MGSIPIRFRQTRSAILLAELSSRVPSEVEGRGTCFCNDSARPVHAFQTQNAQEEIPRRDRSPPPSPRRARLATSHPRRAEPPPQTPQTQEEADSRGTGLRVRCPSDMAKRNTAEFLARAEKAIDSAWHQLPIFKSSVPGALLKVTTAAEDQVRLAHADLLSVGESPYGPFRASQDALRFAIRWIFERCTQTSEKIPTLVSDTDYGEGVELWQYASSYDAAATAFTNYHQARFCAYVSKKDPKITFDYASETSRVADIEKNAFQIEEFWQHPSVAEIDKEDVKAIWKIIGENAKKQQDSRLVLDLNESVLTALRTIYDHDIKSHISSFVDDFDMAGVHYGSIRKYLAALSALLTAHFLLHESPLADGADRAVSSLAFRRDFPVLDKEVRLISQLDQNETLQISDLLKFDGSIPNIDPICQPLLEANATEVIVPTSLVLGSNWERNLLKLLTRNPKTKDWYNGFSSSKEEIAISRLLPLIRARGIVARDRVNISLDGEIITDVDILAFDPRENFLLVVQHKWLIEPDTASELKACDEEFSRGIDQASKALNRLKDSAYARQLLPEIPALGYERLEALVISRGLEPSGFLNEAIPVVTERWFETALTKFEGLAPLYEQARVRTDREELSKKWHRHQETIRLAGYTFIVPGFAAPVES